MPLDASLSTKLFRAVVAAAHRVPVIELNELGGVLLWNANGVPAVTTVRAHTAVSAAVASATAVAGAGTGVITAVDDVVVTIVAAIATIARRYATVPTRDADVRVLRLGLSAHLTRATFAAIDVVPASIPRLSARCAATQNANGHAGFRNAWARGAVGRGLIRDGHVLRARIVGARRIDGLVRRAAARGQQDAGNAEAHV